MQSVNFKNFEKFKCAILPGQKVIIKQSLAEPDNVR
jgi:hypothetical protein